MTQDRSSLLATVPGRLGFMLLGSSQKCAHATSVVNLPVLDTFMIIQLLEYTGRLIEQQIIKTFDNCSPLGQTKVSFTSCFLPIPFIEPPLIEESVQLPTPHQQCKLNPLGLVVMDPVCKVLLTHLHRHRKRCQILACTSSLSAIMATKCSVEQVPVLKGQLLLYEVGVLSLSITCGGTNGVLGEESGCAPVPDVYTPQLPANLNPYYPAYSLHCWD